MTSAALLWGSGLLAFGPMASLLFLVAYQKAQLVIVLTTSAFAYLLSALMASVFWWIFDVIGLDLGVLVLSPGVVLSFLFRCCFVALYHKVEKVIETSIAQHEASSRSNGDAAQRPQNNANNANDNDDNAAWTDSARLRLELNDWSCGLAAGTGFGGMHALLLYGSLLASEAGNLGTLYQESCPSMPSLLLSAFNAFFFSILDVLWMLLTFFGMRRRLAGYRNDAEQHGWGAMLGNDRTAGTNALIIAFVSHGVATYCTTLNGSTFGCAFSLPLLGLVTLGTFGIFWVGASRIYLPLSQRRRVMGDGGHEG